MSRVNVQESIPGKPRTYTTDWVKDRKIQEREIVRLNKEIDRLKKSLEMSKGQKNQVILDRLEELERLRDNSIKRIR